MAKTFFKDTLFFKSGRRVLSAFFCLLLLHDTLMCYCKNTKKLLIVPKAVNSCHDVFSLRLRIARVVSLRISPREETAALKHDILWRRMLNQKRLHCNCLFSLWRDHKNKKTLYFVNSSLENMMLSLGRRH